MPAKRKAENNAPPAPKVRLRDSIRIPMIQKEELVAAMKGAGLDFSDALASSMKIPQYIMRGKNERHEFYDVRSMPPPEYGEADSPLACYGKKMEAPSWVKEWYLRLVEEGGKRYFLLIYRPKKVFMKCEADNAESAVAAEMYLKTIGHH